MSDDKKDEATEWDFKVENVKTEDENVERQKRKARIAEKLGQKEEKRDAQKDLLENKKPKNMGLDTSKTDSRKSRAKLAEEMRKAELPDFNDFMASPVKRGMAFAIDAVIFGILLLALNSLWSQIELYSLQLLRENKIDQPLDPQTYKTLLLGIISVLFYYVFMAFPVLFSKQSWGKSFIGISIQSADEEGNIGFGTLFFREFIVKPISIVTVVGPALLLFNDEKKSLHDMIAGTVVFDNAISINDK